MATSSRRKRPLARRACQAERLELRVAAAAKQVIQSAMAITGLDVGDLAYEAARRGLDAHERMVLSGADRDAFLAAVLNSPEPTDRLVAALRRHRELLA
jgi:uncharacterized protein (DUF1778 family)